MKGISCPPAPYPLQPPTSDRDTCTVQVQEDSHQRSTGRPKRIRKKLTKTDNQCPASAPTASRAMLGATTSRAYSVSSPTMSYTLVVEAMAARISIFSRLM